MTTVSILGIDFHALTAAETLTLLQSKLERPEGCVVVTPNPEAVMQAERNEAFKSALLSADIRLADGIGIWWASRVLKGAPLPERVRGLDTCFALFQTLSDQNRAATAYFLGGAPGVAQEAKANAERLYPAIQVVGWCDGYLNPEKEARVLQEIKNLRPEILLVCMGMPRQELWAAKHRTLPVKLVLCLGGTLDILAGRVSLTPAWLRRIGLEWLHRLLREPRRIKRMLDLPRFAVRILRERMFPVKM
jgi:N-acetylglucosaminyldiphosphoundecaprenol N-acetyl-beta-D-mannosaminyltransferase